MLKYSRALQWCKCLWWGEGGAARATEGTDLYIFYFNFVAFLFFTLCFACFISIIFNFTQCQANVIQIKCQMLCPYKNPLPIFPYSAVFFFSFKKSRTLSFYRGRIATSVERWMWLYVLFFLFKRWREKKQSLDLQSLNFYSLMWMHMIHIIRDGHTCAVLGYNLNCTVLTG